MASSPAPRSRADTACPTQSSAAKEGDRDLRARAQARAAELWVGQAVSARDRGAGEDAIAGLVRIGDQRGLAEVASRAGDSALREAALGKMTDAKSLAELARSDGADLAARQSAIERIGDLEALRAIAVDEQRKEIAMAALHRIGERDAGADVLEGVASKAKNKAVRTRARKMISEQNGEVTGDASDAAAAQRGSEGGSAAVSADQGAGTNGDGQREPAASGSSEPDEETVKKQRAHAEAVQLTRRAEELSRLGRWEQAIIDEFAEIEGRWQGLSSDVSDDKLSERYEKAHKRFHTQLASYRAAVAKRKPSASNGVGNSGGASLASGSADQGNAAEGDNGGSSVQAGPADAGQAEGADGASAPAVAGAAAEAAAEASDSADVSPSPSGATSPDEASAASDEAARKADEEAQRKKEEEARIRQEERAQVTAKVNQLIDGLEALGQANKRKQAERTIQRIHKSFRELTLPERSDSLMKRYRSARQAAQAKVREMREAEEWQRWANVPRQEGLIARAEALLADQDENKLAERLKALQSEWKEVGPVPQNKSRELWERFKTTCDQVYERVKVARGKQNQEMQENLRRKEELCERVEVLSESTDWDRAAEEIKRLQREWRDIGPVPRKRSDAVWKRFRAACDRFFERRKPFLEERLADQRDNLTRKEALCAKAEALAESDDWQQTSNDLRALQRTWRTIGPVPRKDANALQKRFRSACDRFFHRREESRNAERRKLDQAVKDVRLQLLTLLGEATKSEDRAPAQESNDAADANAASNGDGAEGDDAETAQAEAGSESNGESAAAEQAADESLAATVLAIRSQMRELSMSEAQEREIYDLSNRLYLKAVSESPQEFRGTELDPASIRQRKAKLCGRAEELVPAAPLQAPSLDTGSPEEVAERLRAAFARNALSSSIAQNTDSRTILDNIADLEMSWRRIGPATGPEGDELEARFRDACDRARQAVDAR